MFETALLINRSQGRRSGRLAIAVGVHVALIAGVVVAQYWKVDAVQAQDTVEPYIHVGLPPPPPPVGNPDHVKPAAPVHAHDVVVPTPVVPTTTPTPEQPTDVPNDVPVTTTPEVPTDDNTGSSGPINGNGSQNGSEDGVYGSFSDGPVQIRAGITPPEVITRVAPIYTEGARRTHVQGVVILQATIDAQGNVGEVKIEKALPFGLDDNAVAAVKLWKFRPAHDQNGRPIAVYFRLTVDYHLN
ncbi:MAG: energy transducer TonB [Acidobacteriota bacterium]